MRQITRRQFHHVLTGALGAASFAGCDGMWRLSGPTVSKRRLSSTDIAENDPVWRVLNRLSYGPRPGDVECVREMGPEALIDEQLAPQLIDEAPALESRLARLETLNLDPETARERELDWALGNPVYLAAQKLLQLPGSPVPDEPAATATELQQACLLRAVYSRRQLNEIMVQFWSDHFNVYPRKGDCLWLKTIDDRQLRQHAMGKFRDLLRASATSPAMLLYLDNSENVRRMGDAGPNENYARELLELHTLGVSAGYTLKDVQEVARALTGWSLQSATELHPGEFVFRSDRHDDGQKVVLGRILPAGQGQADGEQILDLLSKHPSTAEFISRKLCRRFVADTPPERLVARVAQAFRESDGDMRAVLSTMFHSREFLHGENQKFKRPLEFLVSSLRILDAETTGSGLLPYLESMGHRPFNYPGPDGVPDRAESWLHTLKPRWSFAADLLDSRVPETTVPHAALLDSPEGQSPAEICRQLSRLVLGRALPDEQLRTLAQLSTPSAPLDAAPEWLALCIAGPQFQWQ